MSCDFRFSQVMAHKTSTIDFSRFIFTIYYKGLLRVTRGDRGLEGLQGVTAAYIRLQRLLKDYRRLVFYLERSQILFLGLFYIVLTKTTTNPLERF